MPFPTKRSIAARIEALEEEHAADESEPERLEFESSIMRMAPEPIVSLQFVAQGFVVEREPQTEGSGKTTVRLHTTPPALDVNQATLWHTAGPAANFDDVRIDWDDERREAVVENAAHEVVFETPDLPDDPVVLTDGEGWKAVAPADRVVENLILPRSEAEEFGYDIIEPVPPWIDDGSDLVEVDAEPVTYGEARPD